MGAWGYYDDESDEVNDAIEGVYKLAMPDHLYKSLNDIVRLDYNLYQGVIQKYLQQNKRVVYTSISKWWSSFNKRGIREPQRYIVGVCILTLKIMNNQHKTLPKMDSEMPSGLRSIVHKAIVEMKDNLDESVGWKDTAARKKALAAELKLFS